MVEEPLHKRRIDLAFLSPKRLALAAAERAAWLLAIPLAFYEFLRKHDTVRKVLIVLTIGPLLISYFYGQEGLNLMMSILGIALNLVYAIGFMVIQFGSLFWFISRTRTTEIHPGDPKAITWDDYWGGKSLVERVKQWNLLLTDRGAFAEMGGEALNGLLMDGPPGTGKTMMAKCLAGSGDVAFLGVEGSTFRGMFWGMDSCPLDTPVLTPDGWVAIADLRVGDSIIGRDGLPHNVLALHDAGTKDIYKVVFRDGASVRASDTHHWIVSEHHRHTKKRGIEQLKSTLELLPSDTVPFPDPVVFTHKNLPIPPYLLGALIANGSLSADTPRLTLVDEDVIARALAESKEVWDREFSPVWEETPNGTRVCRIDFGWGRHGSNETPALHALRELALFGCTAAEKFIPDSYLFADVSQRQGLLQGLLDCDGTVDRKGYISYSTTSEKLRDDIIELVCSLGGRASYNLRRKPQSSYWQVNISWPSESYIEPLFCARKAERVLEANTKVRGRSILKIESDGREPAVCITTDAPDGLYITDGYVLTHNTLKIMSFVSKARKLAKRYGACIAYIDEIDAVGASRGNVQGGGQQGQLQGSGGMMGMMGSGALTRLLYEMDGLEELGVFATAVNVVRVKLFALPIIDRGKVMFMGATNRPDVLDPALLRPGRFDQIIHVGMPDEESRREIIEGYLGKITHDDDIDVESLVQDTPMATPAYIMTVITKDAPREAIFDGRRSVSQEDLEVAFQEKLVGISNPISNWDETQKRAVSAHEAGHALTMREYRPDKRLVRVSIIRRGKALGYALDVNRVDVYAHPQSDWAADIAVGLAGDIGAKIVMGERWTGMGGDLIKIRMVVYDLMAHGAFGNLPILAQQGVALDKTITEAVDRYIGLVSDQVERYLRSQKNSLFALTDVLFEREDMSGEDAIKVIEAAKGTDETTGKEGE